MTKGKWQRSAPAVRDIGHDCHREEPRANLALKMSPHDDGRCSAKRVTSSRDHIMPKKRWQILYEKHGGNRPDRPEIQCNGPPFLPSKAC